MCYRRSTDHMQITNHIPSICTCEARTTSRFVHTGRLLDQRVQGHVTTSPKGSFAASAVVSGILIHVMMMCVLPEKGLPRASFKASLGLLQMSPHLPHVIRCSDTILSQPCEADF